MPLILRELEAQDENAFTHFYSQWKPEEKELASFVWKEAMTHEEHLQALIDCKHPDKLPLGYVPSTMLYAFVDKEIVGRLNIRHTLNDDLLRHGGHMGYAVSSLHRCLGYASEMLRLGLLYASEHLALNDILLTCLDDNLGSIKTIEKNGGVLENKCVMSFDNKLYRRYWIHTPSTIDIPSASMACIVLAGGKGSRMKSDLPKVMHSLLGKPLLQHVLELADRCSASYVVSVVSKGIKASVDDLLKHAFPEMNTFKTCIQEVAQGTGDAVKSAFISLQEFKGNILILSGDVPALKEKTIKDFLTHHYLQKSVVSVLTFSPQNPSGYGRIVKNEAMQVTAIVEHKDAKGTQQDISECNSGIYCVQSSFLWSALRQLNNNNVQNEYYLTDIVAIANGQGLAVSSYEIHDEREVMGVNSMRQLSEVEAYMQNEILNRHMENGVRIVNPLHTYIESDVCIGKEVVIYPGVALFGKTVVKDREILWPNTVLR